MNKTEIKKKNLSSRIKSEKQLQSRKLNPVGKSPTDKNILAMCYKTRFVARYNQQTLMLCAWCYTYVTVRPPNNNPEMLFCFCPFLPPRSLRWLIGTPVVGS